MATVDQTAVTTGTKKACVIGGTGNLASILIKHLLQSGYKVNTTVRDPGSLFLLSFLSQVILYVY